MRKYRMIFLALAVAGLCMGARLMDISNFHGGVRIVPDGTITNSFEVENTSGTDIFTITAAGAVSSTGNQTITGDSTVSGTVQAEQLTSTDDATIADDMDVGGNLSVTGTSSLSDDVSITNDCTVGANLSVVGTSNMTGNVTMNAGLTVATAKTDFRRPVSMGEAMWTETGTWTLGNASDYFQISRAAADSIDDIYFPIAVPGRTTASKGMKLTSVDIYYALSGGDADSVEVVLKEWTYPATGDGISASTVSTSYDADHDTEAKRYASGNHTLTLTVDSPAFLGSDRGQYINVTIDSSGTSVFYIYGIVCNYTYAPY